MLTVRESTTTRLVTAMNGVEQESNNREAGNQSGEDKSTKNDSDLRTLFGRRLGDTKRADKYLCQVMEQTHHSFNCLP